MECKEVIIQNKSCCKQFIIKSISLLKWSPKVEAYCQWISLTQRPSIKQVYEYQWWADVSTLHDIHAMLVHKTLQKHWNIVISDSTFVKNVPDFDKNCVGVEEMWLTPLLKLILTNVSVQRFILILYMLPSHTGPGTTIS